MATDPGAGCESHPPPKMVYHFPDSPCFGFWSTLNPVTSTISVILVSAFRKSSSRKHRLTASWQNESVQSLDREIQTLSQQLKQILEPKPPPRNVCFATLDHESRDFSRVEMRLLAEIFFFSRSTDCSILPRSQTSGYHEIKKDHTVIASSILSNLQKSPSNRKHLNPNSVSFGLILAASSLWLCSSIMYEINDLFLKMFTPYLFKTLLPLPTVWLHLWMFATFATSTFQFLVLTRTITHLLSKSIYNILVFSSTLQHDRSFSGCIQQLGAFVQIRNCLRSVLYSSFSILWPQSMTRALFALRKCPSDIQLIKHCLSDETEVHSFLYLTKS